MEVRIELQPLDGGERRKSGVEVQVRARRESGAPRWEICRIMRPAMIAQFDG